MKNYIRLVAGALLGLFMVAMDAWAQTNVTTSTTKDVVGRVVLPDQPPTVDSINAQPLADRPLRLERNKLPPEVLERIRIFEQARKRYLEQQEALLRQLRGATDEERARIRQQVQRAREQWLERARQLRQEFKDRLPDLRDKLPRHREVLEGAREAAREQLRDQTRDPSNRRGQD